MATQKFSFLTLTGAETAGWNSINNLIESIDSTLDASNRLISPDNTFTNGYTLVYDAGLNKWLANQVGSIGIANNAVTTSKINDLAVTSDKIANDTIVNADINSSAGIVDTKLATISTAGKVANSATTATSANTASAIVTRDSSGNFSAGTITASLTGTASTATNLAGGAGGSVPYQSGAGTTAMLANGTAGQVLTSNGTTLAPSWQNASIGTANIADNSVTYAKLATDVKTFDVPTSGTGVYFTSNGDFTTASLSTATTQNPIVISDASSSITLSLPNNIGTKGCTITVCQKGTGSVTISPKSGSAATINGSTNNTYVIAGRYSIITLLCLSRTEPNGTDGVWVITGDYV